MNAELVAATNYSFLRGASHASEMVHRAHRLGLSGLGIADRNTVAGVVRAHIAWREIGGAGSGLKLIVGARLVFSDGSPDIAAYPMTRRGWGRLTRMLTIGNRRATKGECVLNLDDLLEYQEDLALIVLLKPPRFGEVAARSADGGAGNSADTPLHRSASGPPPHVGEVWAAVEKLRPTFTDRLYIGVSLHRTGADARWLEQAKALSTAAHVPLIATNDALYAGPEARALHDVVTCIREGVMVQAAGKRLAPNAERHLKEPAEMVRLFKACPEAIAATTDFLARIDFTLDELRYDYPHEPVPDGWTPQGWLEHMVEAEAMRRYPDGVPPAVRATIDDEFALIRSKHYAPYFLTVHDIVRFARSLNPPILCQGRGSAANSIVCYLLGITSVDPVANKLLFSRFLSEERDEPPDIDVDFEHERREEVMQYIYARYGRERAGIAATVIHYRPRSTIREVAKVMGLSEDVAARLTSTIWGSWGRDVPTGRVAEAGFDPDNPEIARLKNLIDQLLTFPRHLSQHVGGFVLTEGRLDELVPIHNAAMPDRTFIEWDKDDIDALGLMKVDVLSLGMLTCIRKGFDMLRALGQGDYDLQTVPREDPAVYAMLRTGDSIGTFQVESRAQINMLPRMKPREFYDLVIQVAIVRPGPIQGGMVHPYLRRRNGEEAVVFPSPAPPHDPHELREVLGKTLGVPLFQEQAMKLAIVAAGFTPTQSDGLRRAMATFRNRGIIHHYQSLMIDGMIARGYEPDFAERCFEQIKGFGSYGFPESHAQAFAWLTYVSSWLKCRHPAVFTCALLNSQPMGFYAPAQLVRDAQEHKVEVRGVDVNASDWDCGVEPVSPLPFRGGAGGGGPKYYDSPHPNPSPKGDGLMPAFIPQPILRLGLRMIDGFRAEWADAIVRARSDAPFTSMEDLARRAGLSPAVLKRLADADALGNLAAGRRDALWSARRAVPDQLPLFAAMDAPELAEEPDADLPEMPLSEEVVADYQTTRLSLKAHPMQFIRPYLAVEGVLSCADANAAPDGRRVSVAGVVLIRQRPGKGNAVFITIEDESGVVNALLWSRDMERQRRAVMASRLMLIEGEIQRSDEGVVHLMAKTVTDRTDLLGLLSETDTPKLPLSPADTVNRPKVEANPAQVRGHPRNVRVIPKSRDFH